MLNLNPNFDFTKPTKMAFAYHEPSKNLSPTNTPDRINNPGQWRFYDYDMGAIREEVAKEITFSKNLTRDQFNDKEEFYQLLVEHNIRQEKRPAVGHYDITIPSSAIEVDFSKAKGRNEYVDPVMNNFCNSIYYFRVLMKIVTVQATCSF